MDKALQTVVDSQAEFSSHVRECARSVGKENFLIVGEVVGEIPLSYVSWTVIGHCSVFWRILPWIVVDLDDHSALYFGRGKEPEQAFTNTTAAIIATNETDPDK